MRFAPPSLPAHSRKAMALATAGVLTLLAASPGAAAEPVAEADATALVLTLLNTPTDSGAYSATNDGTEETTSGSRNPLITALGNQPFINVGTLSQDASATFNATSGESAACAGLAGDGATLVSVAEGFCLEGGNNAEINAGTLQLQDIRIVQSELLQGIDTTLQAALQPLLTPLLGAVNGVLTTVLNGLGNPGIVLDLGTIQSQCAANATSATGDSQLTDASLYLQLPGVGRVDLVNLPASPPPNTKLLTDLDVVVATISDAVETQLNTALTGVLAPLGAVVGQLTDALNANVISVLADQLGPLEDNILDVTLNKQTTGDSSIEVTALDLKLLPAASAFVDLANIEIGRSRCAAAPRAAVPTPTPTNPETVDPSAPTPAVPTSVPAGEDAAAGTGGNGALNGRIATGAIVLLTALTAAGGTYGFRRVLRG